MATVMNGWMVYPDQKSVHVYTGKNLKDIEIHTVDMLCSSKPGLKGFAIKTSDIFKKIK